MRVALRVVRVVAQCVVSRAMIETNQERACCVVARPPALDDSGGGRPPRTRPLITLRSCRSTFVTSPGGRGGGAHWSGTLRLGWARTLDSHGRGIADPKTFGVVVEGLLPAISPPPRRKLLLSRDAVSVHHSPNALCLALLPRVPTPHRFDRRTVFQHANAHETHCRRTGSTKERGAESQSRGWGWRRAS